MGTSANGEDICSRRWRRRWDCAASIRSGPFGSHCDCIDTQPRYVVGLTGSETDNQPDLAPLHHSLQQKVPVHLPLSLRMWLLPTAHHHGPLRPLDSHQLPQAPVQDQYPAEKSSIRLPTCPSHHHVSQSAIRHMSLAVDRHIARCSLQLRLPIARLYHSNRIQK